MSASARLRSDMLLSKSTARLFFISLFSFILRWGILSLNVTGLGIFIRSDFFDFLFKTYNDVLIITLSGLLFSALFIVSLIFISAVKLGEQFLYFTRAQGSKGRFLLLFKYLHPKKAVRAFTLYSELILLKLFWFIYFLLPFGICIGCIGYIYSLPPLPQGIYTVLWAGASLLLSLSIVMWKVSTLRYSAAPYYICLNHGISASRAIKKSIRFTDGNLAEGVLLEYSFTGWFLSCIFIIPILYVVPKFKLSKCVFITDTVFSSVPSEQGTYAVNYIK